MLFESVSFWSSSTLRGVACYLKLLSLTMCSTESRLSTLLSTMSEAAQHALSLNRKKRGIVHVSVTCLHTRVTELERFVDHPDTTDHARRFTTWLHTSGWFHWFQADSRADSIETAIQLYQQLQSLFSKGGFLLRKTCGIWAKLQSWST